MPAALAIGEAGPLTLTRDDQRGGWVARQRVKLHDGSIREVLRRRQLQRDARTAVRVGVEDLLQRSQEAAEKVDVVTVGDVLAEWLGDLDRGRLAPASVYAYRMNAERSIKGSSLAAMALPDVTRGKVYSHVQAVADERGLGEAKTMRSILRGVFDLALVRDLVRENPATGLPRIRKPEAEKRKPKATRRKTPLPEGVEPTQAPIRDTSRAFTRDEVGGILQHVAASDLARRHNLAVLVYVLAGTGVRIGEACALRWSDVDWEGGTLDIHGTIAREKERGAFVQDVTKTSAGMRRIIAPDWLLDYLREHQRTHLPPSEYVCASSVGTLRDPSNTNKRLRAVLTEAGHNWATAHTFRKTVATLLDEDGASAREIAAHLGHRDPSMTTDVYMDKRRDASTAGRRLDLIVAVGGEESEGLK